MLHMASNIFAQCSKSIYVSILFNFSTLSIYITRIVFYSLSVYVLLNCMLPVPAAGPVLPLHHSLTAAQRFRLLPGCQPIGLGHNREIDQSGFSCRSGCKGTEGIPK